MENNYQNARKYAENFFHTSGHVYSPEAMVILIKEYADQFNISNGTLELKLEKLQDELNSLMNQNNKLAADIENKNVEISNLNIKIAKLNTPVDPAPEIVKKTSKAKENTTE